MKASDATRDAYAKQFAIGKPYPPLATLFAAAGSLVTRMEELQNVIVPINLTILVSFFISIGALTHSARSLDVSLEVL